MVYYANINPSNYQIAANDFVTYASTRFLDPLLYFQITIGNISDTFPDNYANYNGTYNQILSTYRSADILTTVGTGYTIGYSIVWYNKLSALLNAGMTLFVCLLLIGTTMVFSNDLEVNAIAPLEEMMDTIRKMAINPLNAIR
jgi:hypothetical protein